MEKEKIPAELKRIIARVFIKSPANVQKWIMTSKKFRELWLNIKKKGNLLNVNYNLQIFNVWDKEDDKKDNKEKELKKQKTNRIKNLFLFVRDLTNNCVSEHAVKLLHVFKRKTSHGGQHNNMDAFEKLFLKKMHLYLTNTLLLEAKGNEAEMTSGKKLSLFSEKQQENTKNNKAPANNVNIEKYLDNEYNNVNEYIHDILFNAFVGFFEMYFKTGKLNTEQGNKLIIEYIKIIDTSSTMLAIIRRLVNMLCLYFFKTVVGKTILGNVLFSSTSPKYRNNIARNVGFTDYNNLHAKMWPSDEPATLH